MRTRLIHRFRMMIMFPTLMITGIAMGMTMATAIHTIIDRALLPET